MHEVRRGMCFAATKNQGEGWTRSIGRRRETNQQNRKVDAAQKEPGQNLLMVSGKNGPGAQDSTMNDVLLLAHLSHLSNHH